jgi:hypothetical protein
LVAPTPRRLDWKGRTTKGHARLSSRQIVTANWHLRPRFGLREAAVTRFAPTVPPAANGPPIQALAGLVARVTFHNARERFLRAAGQGTWPARSRHRRGARGGDYVGRVGADERHLDRCGLGPTIDAHLFPRALGHDLRGGRGISSSAASTLLAFPRLGSRVRIPSPAPNFSREISMLI